ncbi:MAG: hypothetical protein AAB439_00365 [Patescibacteria group bacterium]
MLHEAYEFIQESGLLGNALGALREAAYEAVDNTYAPVMLEAAVMAADQTPEVTLASAAAASGDEVCDVYPENVEEAGAIISAKCDGGIPATRDIVKEAMPTARLGEKHPLYQAIQLRREGLNNLSDQEIIKFNKYIGLYDPTSVEESAALADGTTFTLRDDGVFEIRDPEGNLILTVGCDGEVTKYQSISMFTSQPCEGLTCVKVPESVAAAAPVTVEEPVIEKPIRVQEQVYWCADDEGTIRAEEVRRFESVEDARKYVSNPDNVDGYQTGRKCPYFWIANGDGNAQRIEFERLKDGTIDLKEETLTEIGINDGKPNYTSGTRIQSFDPLKNLALPDGEKFEKYFTGYAGTSNVRADDGMGYGIEKGEMYMPSAPQEFVYDEKTNTYVREDLETSTTRTVNLWLREAGISSGEWNEVYDMRLPAEFADSGTSIKERAQALIESAATEGVVLSQEDATELSRIITAGQGKDAGFYTPTERFPDAIKTSARGADGSMRTLDEVLFDTARKTSVIQRSF